MKRIYTVKAREWFTPISDTNGRMWESEAKSDILIVADFSTGEIRCAENIDNARFLLTHRLRTREEYGEYSRQEDENHPNSTHPCDGHPTCMCSLACTCHWVEESR